MPNNNILIVEDDESIREAFKLALEVSGYTVFAASNGQEAVEVLGTMPRPRLILLDLMMPIMDGWDFVEAIQENALLASIPVVVITAYGEIGKPIRAQRVMKKPFELKALFKLLEDYRSA